MDVRNTNKHSMRNNKNCYMSRVLVLKCEHVAEVMEISDLTASSSESVFVGAVSPIKTSSTAVVDYLRFTNLASLTSLVSLSLLIL